MRSDSPFHPLDTRGSFDEALAQSDETPVVVFKHSAACGLSARADREMRSLAASSDVPVYRLTVQASRALSDDIARTFELRHESPQVFVLYRRRVAFHASHGAVTERAVREACEAAAGARRA